MEHLADEFNSGRFVRVLLLEMHDKAKCTVFEGSVHRSDYDGVPAEIHCQQPGMIRRGIEAKDKKANHVMTLSLMGEALTPAGGSVCIL